MDSEVTNEIRSAIDEGRKCGVSLIVIEPRPPDHNPEQAPFIHATAVITKDDIAVKRSYRMGPAGTGVADAEPKDIAGAMRVMADKLDPPEEADA